MCFVRNKSIILDRVIMWSCCSAMSRPTGREGKKDRVHTRSHDDIKELMNAYNFNSGRLVNYLIGLLAAETY